MSDAERIAWDRRYREGSHSSRQPDRFLVSAYEEFIQPLFPCGGLALDLAGGTGRHAIYLAERGWRVTLADISEVGLQRARAAADERRVKLEFVAGDTGELSLGDEQFDVVLVFFYLERALFPRIAASLRAGGLVVYKTYTREHEKFANRPFSHPLYFLEPNELLHAFPGFVVLHYHETMKEKGTAELVVRKPET